MAKKNLKDPSEGNKNLRGVGVLITPVEKSKKEEESNHSIDNEEVVMYSLRIPVYLHEKLKYEIAKDKKASMRDLILEAIKEYYKI